MLTQHFEHLVTFGPFPAGMSNREYPSPSDVMFSKSLFYQTAAFTNSGTYLSHIYDLEILLKILEKYYF